MTIDQIRDELIKAYSGPAWRMRVMGMGDRQVFAIYQDMRRKNRLGKKSRESKTKLKEEGVQLNIWDLLNEQSTERN